jgi:MFS family permease
LTTSEPSNDEITPRTPPLVYSALVFALLGFACGVPAIVGLILGIVGRRRAKAVGAGVGLATAAIAVSAAWLVGIALLLVNAQLNVGPNSN